MGNLKRSILIVFGILFCFGLFPDRTHPTEERVRLVIEKEAPELSEATREAIGDTVLLSSKKHGVDPILLLAIVKVESSFQISARSPTGSVGLMQVQPVVVREIERVTQERLNAGRKNLMDPVANIETGSHYFSLLLDRFDGNPWQAILAYNIGPTAVAKKFTHQTPPATDYTTKVFRTYFDFLDS